MVDRANGASRPVDIRNVALVGGSGSGKTTLVDALALAAGAVNRIGRVEDGTSLSDYDEIEQRRHRSVQLSVVPVHWGGVKVNLIDTPGYADFVGELRAGLRAADAAVFVVSAADGIEGVGAISRALWEECASIGMPRAIVLTHLDTARADFEEMTQTCQALLGGDSTENVLPLHLPVYGPAGADGHRPATGLVELLERRVADYSTGERSWAAPTPRNAESIAQARNQLIEGIIAESEDESLMDRYLEGEPIDPGTLVADLERAVARGSFHPVLFAAPAADPGRQGLGTIELLDLITAGFPMPSEHAVAAVPLTHGGLPVTLRADPGAQLAAEVIRTCSDPYVGRVSLVRMFSGTLHADDTVHIRGHSGGTDHEGEERVGGVTAPFGKEQRPLNEAVAGDIAYVTKLGHAETGDTLSDPDSPLLIEPWPMPDPLLPTAVRAHSKADEDKLSHSLGRLVAEDPSLRVENNERTGQMVLWCLGETQRDVALERLRTRFGVSVDTEDYRVALRETFADKIRGHGRHVKQSGGHGQYAVCDIEVEPAPEGSGIEFADKVIGGAVPRQFITSVEKGVRAQAARGVAAGYPLVDVRVTLIDGKAHSVDSSDTAFQTAGALALRDAAAAGRIDLLEPIAQVMVGVPDEFLGTTLADLAVRRARILGTEPAESGRTMIRAEVPEVELAHYAVDLRALTHGIAHFTRRYLRYNRLPAHMVDKTRDRSLKAAAPGAGGTG